MSAERPILIVDDDAVLRDTLTEQLAIDGVSSVDPLRALAMSVVTALARPALEPEGLTALYVD